MQERFICATRRWARWDRRCRPRGSRRQGTNPTPHVRIFCRF